MVTYIMKYYELSVEELQERLMVLKSVENLNIGNKRIKILGEIKYIENMLQTLEFSKHNEFPNL